MYHVGGGSLDMPKDLANSETTERYDLAPWAMTSQSSRVRAYRYNYTDNSLQVLWRNRPSSGYGYVYEDVSYEQFRAFARASSLGKRINNPLTYGPFQYRPMSLEEETMPSNPARRGLQSRTKRDMGFSWENPSS
jgi:hypothetical protein